MSEGALYIPETADVWDYVVSQLAEEDIGDTVDTAVYNYIDKHRPPTAFLDPTDPIDTWILTGGRGCVAAGTRIYNPITDQHVPVEDWTGGPVLSWNTRQQAWEVSRSTASFVKGVAPLFRVATDRGDVVTVTGRHRFLTRSGWEHLDRIGVGTELALADRSVSPADGQRSSRTPVGSLAGCHQPRYSHGLQLPLGQATGQAPLPSPGDAHAHTRTSSLVGDGSSSLTHSQDRQRFDHHSRTRFVPSAPSLATDQSRTASAIDDMIRQTSRPGHPSHKQIDPHRPWLETRAEVQAAVLSLHAQCAEISLPRGGHDGRPSMSYSRASGPHVSLATSHLGTSLQCERGPSSSVQFSQACLDSTWWGRIVSIEPVGEAEFYDLTVEHTHNYVAEGIVHHNSSKTFCGALYYNEKMRSRPGVKGRIIAPTVGEAIAACVTGESGLLTLFPDLKLGTERGAAGSTKVLKWPNGSEAAILGAWSKAEVRKFRAVSNRSIDWFDEFTHIPLMMEAWEQSTYGRRIGTQPQAIITTTPTADPDWAAIMESDLSVHTHATMFDNPHLSEQYKENILERFGGTALAGQEIWGEILTDVQGALWNSTNLNQHRIGIGDTPVANLTCVGVDPAVGSGTTGIAVASSFKIAGRWHLGALDDYSKTDCQPEDWANAAIQAYLDYDADYVIAEGNQGMRMVASTIKNAADNWPTEDGSILTVPVKMVNARDGKATRAQPISMLFEQGRGHVIGRHGLMENELTTWVPDSGMDSPDRLDALVWACTWLSERFRRGRGTVNAPS